MSNNSTHTATITLSDGREVFQSYGVTVAAFIPRGTFCDSSAFSYQGGFVRTDARFSVTTSRHMNQYAGKDAPTVPHAELLALCAPVASKQ